MLESAIGNQNIFSRPVARIRLERNVIVADIDHAVTNQNVSATGWIDRISVWRIGRRSDRYVLDGYIMAALRHQVKLSRVFQSYTLNEDIPAVSQHNEFGARTFLRLTGRARLALLGHASRSFVAKTFPPRRAGAVDCTFAADRDVRQFLAANQRQSFVIGSFVIREVL